jgi:hypothetical protein
VPKDQRLYGKFTLNFPRHPKIAILSDAAFRCLVEATLYSRDELTDGLLASRYAIARWGLEVLTELTLNDDDKPSLIEVEKGWLIHDYAEHQDTKAEVEARSARNKANGQKGGIAKGKQVAKPVASESLSENLAVVETETETLTTSGQVSEAPRKRGQHLPDNWRPSEKTIEWAKTTYPHLDHRTEFEKFTNHWKAASGQSARKRDWDAAFRNWLHNARPPLKAVVNGSGSTVDDKVNGWLDLANSNGRELE